MHKALLFIAFALILLQNKAYSQKNHSWEVEGTVLASNRHLSMSIEYPSGGSSYWMDKAEFSSRILPGGYIQFGINFREGSRTRIFTGLRLMNQQVMLISS